MFVAIIPLGLLIALHAIGLLLFIGWMIGPLFGSKAPRQTPLERARTLAHARLAEPGMSEAEYNTAAVEAALADWRVRSQRARS